LLPAWQPVTFCGVAAFAGAAYRRLLVVQTVVGLLVAASVLWFVGVAWEPVILDALRELPDQGQIRAARFDWEGDSPRRLAGSRFLTIVLDRDGTASPAPEADLEVKLGRDSVWLRSLLGYMEVPYPGGWVIAVNRPELQPWWEAHRPAIYGAIAVAVLMGLWAGWGLMALPYAVVARFIGFLFDAQLTWAAAWRLSCAALLPGALVMAGAILLYAEQRLNLVGFLLALPLHIMIGWPYLLVAPARLASLGRVETKGPNPFAITGSPDSTN
jgi:hypothetical protein